MNELLVLEIPVKSSVLYLNYYFKNALIIHEQNTKKITTVAVSLYVIKAHVYFHKTFASIFSAYTISDLKILSQTQKQMGIKWIVFEAI